VKEVPSPGAVALGMWQMLQTAEKKLQPLATSAARKKLQSGRFGVAGERAAHGHAPRSGSGKNPVDHEVERVRELF